MVVVVCWPSLRLRVAAGEPSPLVWGARHGVWCCLPTTKRHAQAAAHYGALGDTQHMPLALAPEWEDVLRAVGCLLIECGVRLVSIERGVR